MIRALAIETSSQIGSVALVANGQVVAEQTFPHGLAHAARMVPAIDELCRQMAWTSTDLREIYVSAGPGSFTGLRIGITLAKTLAYVTGAKLISVPTVNVLAANAPAEAGNVMIVLDAKREQIFSAWFERVNEMELKENRDEKENPAGNDWVHSDRWILRVGAQLTRLRDMLSKVPRPVHLLGEGIPYHRKFIDESDNGVIVTDETLWRPRAASVAEIGWRAGRAQGFVDPFKLTPIYIRRPEAEEKLENAQIHRL